MFARIFVVLNTQQKGEIARLEVMRRAAERGWIASVPTTEARYDLVLDDSHRLYRIQVKYASYSQNAGSVDLNLKKQYRNLGPSRNYLSSEVDAVVVFVPAANKCYWLGPDQFHDRKRITIRFAPCINRQWKGVKMATDFEW